MSARTLFWPEAGFSFFNFISILDRIKLKEELLSPVSVMVRITKALEPLLGFNQI